MIPSLIQVPSHYLESSGLRLIKPQSSGLNSHSDTSSLNTSFFKTFKGYPDMEKASGVVIEKDLSIQTLDKKEREGPKIESAQGK